MFVVFLGQFEYSGDRMEINGGTVNFAHGCANERADDPATTCTVSRVTMTDYLSLTGGNLRAGSLEITTTAHVTLDASSSIDVDNGGFGPAAGPGSYCHVFL